MLPYFTSVFGNAASADHAYGWEAKEAVDAARKQVAKLLHAKSSEITFTSGATEAINLALKGLMVPGGHIITNRAEHKAVLDTCVYLEEKGHAVTYLDVDVNGQLSLEALAQAIRPETAVIAIQYANNETGVIHPVAAIGAIARKHNVRFLCDATQAVGKIPVDVVADQVDLLAFSGHKIYGPKGIGVLYVKAGIELEIQQHGGQHERGRRSGTLNVPAIVGLGAAVQISDTDHLGAWRDRLEAALVKRGAVVNGVHARRLPHVSNIYFPGVNAEQLLLSVSSQLALSRGSACSSTQRIPSHVLMAMGLGADVAHESVRISLGRLTTGAEVDTAITILSKAIPLQ
jgi:cysteine desulfurase